MRLASKLLRALLPLIFLITSLPLLVAKKELNIVVAKDTQVEFNLAILPVRFVYLDEQKQISKIWNNASINDQQYLLKFFDSENREIKINNQQIIKQYFTILESTNPFDEGYIFDRESNKYSSNTAIQDLKIELKSSSFGLEEIYTYI